MAVSVQKLPYWKKWIYAFKVQSWPKVVIAFWLGQGLGVYTAGRFSVVSFLSVGLFTVLGVIFIVLLNDYGDRRIDKIKRNMFPEGCSPKTIPDGVLPARHLLWGGLLAIGLAFLSILIGGYLLGRPMLLGYALLCALGIVWYTLPPLKLNYRGGGEFMEMFGVAVLLPLFSAYAQADTWEIPGVWQVLLPYASLSLASAVASGMSDEQSDIVGGKRTIVTMLGNPVARFIVQGLVLLSFVCHYALFFWSDASLFPLWVVTIANLILLYNVYYMRRWSYKAITNAFAAQKMYKLYLHRAIWHSTFWLAAYLLAYTLFYGEVRWLY